MTDLCSLEGALHDIHRSNQIMEVLVANVISHIRVIKEFAKIPDELSADEMLLDFEISRQHGHCAEAKAIIADLQGQKASKRPARIFYRTMKREDIEPGATVMIGGNIFEIGRFRDGLNMWDLFQDDHCVMSVPAKHLLKVAWLQSSKRH